MMNSRAGNQVRMRAIAAPANCFCRIPPVRPRHLAKAAGTKLRLTKRGVKDEPKQTCAETNIRGGC